MGNIRIGQALHTFNIYLPAKILSHNNEVHHPFNVLWYGRYHSFFALLSMTGNEEMMAY
jgi:hypothetical protein